MTSAADFVTVARVVKTQGRHGEVAAVILTDFPEKFAERKRLCVRDKTGRTRELQVDDHWPHKSYIVFKFEGVDSITDAEVLVGCDLQIPRSERSALDVGSVYVGDLVGCILVDVTGESHEIGVVSDVDSTSGEAPNLVVTAGAKLFFIPFAQAYLRNIDLNAKRIEMGLPEGLLEIDAPLSTEEKVEQRKVTRSPDDPITR